MAKNVTHFVLLSSYIPARIYNLFTIEIGNIFFCCFRCSVPSTSDIRTLCVSLIVRENRTHRVGYMITARPVLVFVNVENRLSHRILLLFYFFFPPIFVYRFYDRSPPARLRYLISDGEREKENEAKRDFEMHDYC